MKQKKCNVCGRVLREEDGILKEDVLEVTKTWGYFSDKDMERHNFLVCECCYDQWISGFRIPPVTEECTEAL